MTHVQRFISWCIGAIVLIAAVTLGYYALTNAGTTAHLITSVVGALVAAGKGAAHIVISVVSYIAALF